MSAVMDKNPLFWAALIGALHSASQDQLPITMMAAGLPQLVGQAGRAKSYAERLFEFVPMDRLDPAAAGAALCVPAAKSNVTFDDAAISEILAQTLGYPYFLQEWGKHSWNLADRSPIKGNDARRATVQALAELDASFFRVRFDRLAPGNIADRLGRRVTAVAPVRSTLIAKGMIYSPAHGDTAFTVPLFDGFMKRTMPEWN